MPGKFVVKKGTTGKFRFTLLSTNGQVVATSQAYETKRAALNGIASVQRLAAAAGIVDATSAAARRGSREGGGQARGEEARRAQAGEEEVDR